jgi:O-antigen/teichoic acid export membrane protein
MSFSMSAPPSSMNVARTTSKPRIGADAIFGTFGTNVVIQACTVFQGVLLARLLGPVGRGEFAAVILWPSLFAAIGLFGLGTALARHAGTASDEDALTRAGLVLGFGLAVFISISCYLMMPLLLKGHDVNLVRMSKWFVPFIFFNHMTLVFVSIDQGGGNFKQFNWTRLILNPIYLALVLAIWLAGRLRVAWFVMGLLVANAIVVAVRFGKFLRGARLVGPVYPLEPVARDAVRYGLADLIRPLYQQADKALLLYLLGVQDLGLYTVALSASGVAGSFASAASSVTFGIAARDRESATFERIAQLFRCSGCAWLAVGGSLALVMPVMLPLIFGKDFTPAIWPAICLIPASVFAGQAAILEQSMRAQGRAFVGLEAQAVGLVIMVVAACVASRFWGTMGIVLACNLSQMVCLIMFCIRARAHFGKGTISCLVPRWDDLKTIWTAFATLFHKYRLSALKAIQ